jgi:hypothetical protein
MNEASRQRTSPIRKTRLLSLRVWSADAYEDIVCESGVADCDAFLKVTKAEYEDVRPDARKFILFRDISSPTSRTSCWKRIDS